MYPAPGCCHCCYAALVVAAGCATVKTDTPEAFSGIIPPTQRIADLRELAATAATKNATEKQMISQQLAADIKHPSDPLIRAQMRARPGRISGPGFRHRARQGGDRSGQ